jgi:hypothetical protein
MIKWIKFLWNRLFGKPSEQIEKRPRPRKKKSEEAFTHYYFGDLLDHIDSVFADYELLRHADPDAYAMSRSLGVTVTSSSINISQDIEPYVLQSLPAFGCIHLGRGHNEDHLNDDRVPPKFLYFVKEDKPINVHRQSKVIAGAGVTTYRCGAIYELKGKTSVAEFYVGVSGTSISALKVCRPVTHSTSKKSRPIVRMEWSYPPCLIDYAVDRGKKAEEVAVEWFSAVANFSQTREFGMTVTVEKNKRSAAFSVDLLRTPYFFSGREKTVTENGKTKPIIHLVRGHWRTLSGGEKKFVKPHFRGTRRFVWNGYNVRVGMAGWHGAALSEWDVAAVDKRTTNAKTLTADEAAAKIAEIMA